MWSGTGIFKDREGSPRGPHRACCDEGVHDVVPKPAIFAVMANKTAQLDLRSVPTVDQVGIEERVARIKTRSIKKEAKVQGMKLALSMIDLTTL